MRTPQPGADATGTVGATQGPDLVNRAHEKAALAAILDAVRLGMSGTLVLRGEPGIGKTALLEHMVSAASDFRVARAVGIESEMELGFAGLHQLVVPFLPQLDRLPVPQRDALASAFGLLAGTPPDRFQVGLATLTLLADAASKKALLCLVDDAQWLDIESSEVLAFVARRLYADRIALIFAVREATERRGALTGVPELHIGGLLADDVRRLLATIVDGAPDAHLSDRIMGETQGNPLAILELTADMTPGQLGSASQLPQPLPIGSRLQQHFVSQVRELPPETQLFLLLAAAEPSGDPVVLWRAARSLGINREAVAPAESDRLLVIGPRVSFRHPLIRSAIYHGAPAVERRRVHAALAAATDVAIDPDRRAWHRAAAIVEPNEDVAAELAQSGERAQRHGSHASAGAFFSRGAELTPDHGAKAQRLLAAAQASLMAGAPDRAQASLDEAMPLLHAPLQRALARSLEGGVRFALGQAGEAPSILVEAARSMGPLDLALARQALFGALDAAVFLQPATTGPLLREIAHQVIALPRTEGSPINPADLILDGYAALITDGYPAGAPLLKRAIGAMRSEEPDPGADLRLFGLAALAASSLFDDASSHILVSRWVRLARERAALTVLPIALASLSAVEMYAGRTREGEDLGIESLEISAATGNPSYPSAASRGDVSLLAWRGDEAEARASAAAKIAEALERGHFGTATFVRCALIPLDLGLRRYQPALDNALPVYKDDPPFLGSWVLPNLVEAAVRSGNEQAARDALSRLSVRSLASGTPLARGFLARSQALLAAVPDAESLYKESIDQLGQSPTKPELGRSHLLYGEWLRRQGRKREARDQLRAAYDMFSSMELRAFADRARGELEATGERARKRSVETQSQLTPQEAQVARLAGQGLRNQEIAAQLFVSASTVEYHLVKVFRKLGVSSRTQLAHVL